LGTGVVELRIEVEPEVRSEGGTRALSYL